MSKNLFLPIVTLTSVAAFGLLSLFSVLDFDPHHDGVMLAPAIAVAEGLPLFSGAFSQYGPVTHWLHGTWLFFWPGAAAVGLRTLNSVLIVVTAHLLADLGRVAPKSWRVSSSWTFPLAWVWFLLNDVFLGVPMLPWSSVLASLILVTIVHLLARRSRLPGTNRALILMFVVGIMIGLLIFTRQSVGVTLVALLVLVVPFFWASRMAIRKELRAGMIGLLATIAGIVGSLLIQRSFQDWFLQSVAWPIEWARAASNRGSPLVGLESVVGITVVVLSCLLLVLFSSNEFRGRAVLFSAFGLLAVTAGALSFSGGLFFAHEFNEALATPWSAWLLETSARAIFVFLAVGILSIFAAIWLIYMLYKSPKQVSNWGPGLLLVAVAVASLSQLFPVPDSRHAWWALGPVTPVIAWTMSFVGQRVGITRAFLPSLALWSVTLPLTAGANLIMVERVHYPSNSVAQGMMGRPDKVADFMDDLEFMSQGFATEKVLFLTIDGHLSVISGNYLAHDQFFVGWGPVGDFSDRIGHARYLVADSDQIEYVSDENVSLVSKSEDGKLSLFLLR